MLKNSLANAGDTGSMPGFNASILAWEILWTEETGGLQSMELQRVKHKLAAKPPPPPPFKLHCKKAKVRRGVGVG